MKRLRLIALLFSLFLVGTHYVYGVSRSLVRVQHRGVQHIAAKKQPEINLRDALCLSRDVAVDNNDNDEDNDHDDFDRFQVTATALLKCRYSCLAFLCAGHTAPQVFSRFRQYIVCLLPAIYLFQRSILV